MKKFIAALNHRIGLSSGFGTYLTSMRHPCLRSKKPSDCDGIPSREEARKDYRAAMETRTFL